MISGSGRKWEMSKSKHSEAQVIAALKQVEDSRSAEDVARKRGISMHTISGWKTKYRSLEVNEAQRLRALEAENSRLNRLVADLIPDREILKPMISNNSLSSHPNAPNFTGVSRVASRVNYGVTFKEFYRNQRAALRWR